MFRGLAGLLLAAVLMVEGVAAEEGGYRFIEFDAYRVKWGVPEMGHAAEVTYAYVARPTLAPDAHNCRAMAPLDGLLRFSGIGRAAFEREVAEAFALWEAAAGITFARVADLAEADILIGAQATPRRFGYTNVTPKAPIPANGATAIRPLAHARICLNPAKRWKIGFDGDLDVYDLRYTVAHEIGHAIGLDHPGRGGQLMGFAYEERFRGLQPGDVAGARQLYGPSGAEPLPGDALTATADALPE